MSRTTARRRTRASRLGAVIVAAGTSQRMAGVNKLFASLRGKPLVAWSVDTCERCRMVHQIVLVLNSRDLARGQRLKKERGWSKVTLCGGGTRRQDSVREGLSQIENSDWVLIHDGARPFLTPDLIREGLKAARDTGAAIAAVPVKNTIKLTKGRDLVKQTLRRDRLWEAQTPQIFGLDIITRAYENLTTEVTDDSTAVERLGHVVRLYMGDYKNVKVTTREDLVLARIIAGEWKEKN